MAKQITTYKLDRGNNICLVVYLDKVNKTREIFDIDKNFCNNFEIMQYTGLKDKKDVEIYEGDIVKLKYVSQPQQISYSPVLASFIIGNEYRFTAIQDIKVIGNIYENPELLEEENK